MRNKYDIIDVLDFIESRNYSSIFFQKTWNFIDMKIQKSTKDVSRFNFRYTYPDDKFSSKYISYYIDLTELKNFIRLKKLKQIYKYE